MCDQSPGAGSETAEHVGLFSKDTIQKVNGHIINYRAIKLEIPTDGIIEHGYQVIALGQSSDETIIVGNINISEFHLEVAWLSNLFVHPEYREHGIARNLICKSVEICQDEKRQSISLTVDKKINIISWYERLGFIKSFEYEKNFMMTYALFHKGSRVQQDAFLFYGHKPRFDKIGK